MQTWLRTCLLLAAGSLLPGSLLPGSLAAGTARPNVILILCDDLNDYVEGFGGHPDSQTPNLARLARSGMRFLQAHCNAPICAPSRASLFTGIYPHHSGCFGFQRWDRYPVLKNSRTLMDHFRANGYHTLGTGKLLHHLVRQEWSEYGNPADYGPFAFDGTQRIAHPDVPAPYRDIGAVDGSFGPLVTLAGRTSATGHPLQWQTGGWGRDRVLPVASQEERDPTADERNGDWAVKKLRQFAAQPGDKPFFMGVGLIRPHTPLVVPKRFFDQFPLDSLQLPVIKPGDVDDTHARSVRGIPTGQEPNASRTADMGLRLFQALSASYPSPHEGLRRFLQAYLASVASVDEQIGRILEVVDASRLKENTIVVVTSDHGWGMGEKDYLYKNSLWQESTRVPLIVRVPGISQPGSSSDQPVSLIDLYPTLADLCQLRGETRKNPQGHPLDGHSLRPLLENPQADTWSGPPAALTALYKWAQHYDPARQSYSLRSVNWRYIRYSNGREELYETSRDPHEWTNLADSPEYATQLLSWRQRLQQRLPAAGAIPPQLTGPAARQNPPQRKPGYWKDRYYKKHPGADADGDGRLSWMEFRAHRGRLFDMPAIRNPATLAVKVLQPWHPVEGRVPTRQKLITIRVGAIWPGQEYRMPVRLTVPADRPAEGFHLTGSHTARRLQRDGRLSRLDQQLLRGGVGLVQTVVQVLEQSALGAVGREAEARFLKSLNPQHKIQYWAWPATLMRAITAAHAESEHFQADGKIAMSGGSKNGATPSLAILHDARMTAVFASVSPIWDAPLRLCDRQAWDQLEVTGPLKHPFLGGHYGPLFNRQALAAGRTWKELQQFTRGFAKAVFISRNLDALRARQVDLLFHPGTHDFVAFDLAWGGAHHPTVPLYLGANTGHGKRPGHPRIEPDERNKAAFLLRHFFPNEIEPLLPPPTISHQLRAGHLQVTTRFPAGAESSSGRIWWIYDRPPDGSRGYLDQMIPDNQWSDMQFDEATRAWTVTIPLDPAASRIDFFSNHRKILRYRGDRLATYISSPYTRIRLSANP